MLIPDRLALTLQRIDEYLALIRIEDFGGDDECARMVIDDLHYLHGELKAGRKTLPFPTGERRPLDIAYGYEGHFSDPFSELHDRTVELFDLFDANKWPLLPWQAEPLGENIEREDELRLLYTRLRDALIAKDIDGLMTIIEPALKATSCALGDDEESEFLSEKEFVEELMALPDYRSEAPRPEIPVIRPLFDGCRVRLLHPEEERHALGIWPYTESRKIYPIQCQFGRIDGQWMVVGYD